MNTHMKRYSIFLALALCCGCITRVNYTQKTYASLVENEDETIEVSYTLPKITPTAKTKNMQEKGGVIISVELLPLTIERKVETERTAVTRDPSKPTHDRFEVKETPHYEVEGGAITFKIRVRNNEEVPLRLSSIGFALVIDGTQWSFPDEQIEEWNKGLILSGFEKEYTIKGPDIESLANTQVVYVLLNGVPTKYNQAGVVTKKSNFEWYYQCEHEQVTKEEVVKYRYESEIIRSEQCSSCKGSGKNPKSEVCSRCKGHGKLKGYGGSVVQCKKCTGTGKVYPTCTPCKGNGSIKYPESQNPRITSSVNWYGWRVKVVRVPSGAIATGYNPVKGEYEEIPHPTPFIYGWYRTKDKTYPITVELNGKKVKVLPLKADGNPCTRIQVDFTGDNPRVVVGTEVTE